MFFYAIYFDTDIGFSDPKYVGHFLVAEIVQRVTLGSDQFHRVCKFLHRARPGVHP